MTISPVIRLHPDDGVLIARASLPPGTLVADGVTTVERIPSGHKVAIKPIAVGEPVAATARSSALRPMPIAPGQHVHTHNCGMGDFAKRLRLSAPTHSRRRTSICRRPSRASAAPTAASPRATTSASSPR